LKKIRPIPRRGSTSKGFGDHYHVEGLDPKTNTFSKDDLFIFFKKSRPILRRGSTSKGFGDHYHVEGLDPKTYTFSKYDFFFEKE